MDISTVSVLHRADRFTEGSPPSGEAARTLLVKAVYLLSENGRKVSLLCGGNGRAIQEIDAEVPTNRLHLVHVDSEGHASLRLRPRYEVKPDGRVVQIDSPPTYDRPPTLDELFLAAAKNHELERAYVAQGGRRARQREALRDRRARIAETFPRQSRGTGAPTSAALAKALLRGQPGRSGLLRCRSR